MTVREALHRLVDDLPDDDLPAAAHLLETLRSPADLLSHSLENAPFDDEPDDDDFDGGLTEARNEAEAGGGVSTEELRRKLGLQ